MKTKYYISIFFLLLLTFVSCSRISSDINEEIVFDKHPYFFGNEGIDPKPLKQGSCVMALTTNAYRFSMLPEQYEEGFTNLISRDQAAISLNAFLTLKIRENHSPILLRNFGLEWYKNNVQEKFREIVRNKLCSYSMLELVVNRHLYEEDIKKYINENLSEYFREKGLPLDIHDIVISKSEPSNEIKAEMEQTSIYDTKIQTEKRRTLAEEARLEAEVARAKADRAYMETMGFTHNQFIEYIRALALYGKQIFRMEDIK